MGPNGSLSKIKCTRLHGKGQVWNQPKNAEKYIKLSVFASAKYLNCEVGDDGLGSRSADPELAMGGSQSSSHHQWYDCMRFFFGEIGGNSSRERCRR